MEIIRVVENSWNFHDSKEPESYLIMDVNWFRERVWVVSVYKNDRDFGRTPTHFQREWNSVEELLKGVMMKEKTLNPLSPYVNDVLHVLKIGPQEQNESGYRTVRWFPKLRGLWSNNETFIRDFDGHNMLEWYPEYFI